MKTASTVVMACLLGLLSAQALLAAAYRNPYGKFPPDAGPGDRMLAESFRLEAQALGERCLADIRTLADWNQRKDKMRQQLFEMLSLDPLPPRTDLKATITGTLDHLEFTVEKLHFQSRPGLYVTANVYVPKRRAGRMPAILYVCGHSLVKTNGISYGNKTAYQHHGIWFARRGYVCLVMDTVQLGELEGIHHGTYREGMWWWNSRGYSSAGVEAWNSIRALDYLQSRPDVDPERLGMTGRSGGGAYTWWAAALDERVKAACPVAGITDLQNYVTDGAVEGHCDCMFTVNTHRWDYPHLAALVAPRPLLICNTDKDTLFPLDGVVRLHEQVRRIYDLHNAPDKLGLLITEGPHKDTQDLQVPVFRWFDRWLRQSDEPVEFATVKLFSPEQLRVFDRLPADEITTKCHESFTVMATDESAADVQKVLATLREKTFGGWPSAPPLMNIREVSSVETGGVRLTVHEFESQPGLRLRFYVAQPVGAGVTELHLQLVDETEWRRQLKVAGVGFSAALTEEFTRADIDTNNTVPPETTAEFASIIEGIRGKSVAYVTFAPRGVGLSALSVDKRYLTQVRRRFMLLGQTLAGMQVWDTIRAAEALRATRGLGSVALHLRPVLSMTEVAAFASLFGPELKSLTLAHAPRPDQEAPDFLNWSRLITPTGLLKLAGRRCAVTVQTPGAAE